MRSCIKTLTAKATATANGGEQGAEFSVGKNKKGLMKRFGLFLSLLFIFMFGACDQTPTTFDDVAFKGESSENIFSAQINQFEFDYLSQRFFFSIAVSSPLEITEVTATLGVSNSPLATLNLNDLGQEADILVADGHYDGAWILPDSLSSYVDSLWNIEVRVRDINMQETLDQDSLNPVVPAAPVIGTIWHRDTLQLVVDSLLLDTLTVEVTHPKGLDEIRDVWLMSRKPDSTWSNNKQPIHLYDDGGNVVFFNYKGVDFTSGDKIRGDGIYSLMVGFENDQFTQVGTYDRTFYARSWFGLISEPVADTLVLIAPANLSFMENNSLVRSGVFK